MVHIRYYTSEYIKLQKYIRRFDTNYYICISQDTKVQIIRNKITANGRLFDIDPVDFIKVDMFLVDNKIKCNFRESSKSNINELIKKNYIDAIAYLVETEFACADIRQPQLINFFDVACESSCIDIIMVLLIYIKSIKIRNRYFISNGLEYALGHRDENIVSVLLDNIPDDYIEPFLCTYEAITHGRLQNLILVEQKYPDESILEHLDIAIEEGHIDIVEHMISQGANLEKFFCRKNTKNITGCAENGHMEMIEYLFGKINLSKMRLNLLLSKSYRCCPEYIDILIDAGANFIVYGEQLYTDALMHNNMSLAAYLKKNYL